MSVTIVSRTEVTPPPDILKRVRLFLIAITYAALIVSAITVLTQQSKGAGGVLGVQLATLAALPIWWTLRLRVDRARWFDLAIDFALLSLLTGTAQAPESTLGVYFPAILLRSMYEGRRLAFVRPFAYSGALALGTLAAMSAVEASGDATRLLVSLAPLLMTGGISGALAQLVLSHRAALEQESDLLALSTQIAGEHRPDTIAQSIARTVQSLASRTCGESSKALVVLLDEGEFKTVSHEGTSQRIEPVIGVDLTATSRQFGENIALSIESMTDIMSNDPSQFCTIAPFGSRGSNRGAIAVCTPRPPSMILRNGLGLAAENAGLAIEGADLNASLRASEERRTALLSEVVTASEDQRATLAGDLHDGPIQSLTALTFELDFADDLLESSEIEGGRRALRAMKQQLFSEIGQLRQTMTRLLPPTLSERGIEKALRDYTRQQAAANDGIRFTFESEIKARPAETAERMLYRVAQEALANAIRHARSTQIDVSVTGGDDGILITISDDGRGFDTDHVSDLISRDRFGIASMQHIMEMIGGALKITSSPAAGTTVRMSAPIAPSEAQSISDEMPAVQ